MAALLKAFHGYTLVVDGVEFYIPFGSVVGPIAEKTIADGKNPVVRKVKVPAGEMVTAWRWADTEGFAAIFGQMVGGEGYVEAAIRYRPTVDGEDDLDPDTASAVKQWVMHDLSCFEPFSRGSERASIHATAATAVGDTSDYPTVWSSGTRVRGVADVLTLFNESDVDYYVWLLVVPK